MLKRIGWGLALLVISTGNTLAEDDTTSALAGRLDEYLGACAEFGWSGAVLVALDGEVVLRRGYGLADRAGGRANAPDTLFEIASVTKVFTACAVMKLVETGTLSLDDPIARHLPGVPEDKQDITVRHLLTHTSGVSRMVAGGGKDARAAVASYLSKPRTRKAGETFEYWNGGFALIAALIETVSGRSYQQFCAEHLFRPAGMTDSGFTGDQHLPADRQARGYDGEKPVRLASEHPYRTYDYGYKGMGGVVTTADDLWRFSHALLAGKILKPATRALMETASIRHQGFGWGVLESERGTPRLVHGGDVKGFHTAYEVLPAERATIIVLSNVEGVPMWKIQWNLQSMLFEESLRYPVPPTPIDLADEALDALVGEYGLPGGDGTLAVERSGAGVSVGAEGNAAVSALSSAELGEAMAAAGERARAILDAILVKDLQAIEDALPDGAFYAKSWPPILVEKLWPAQIAKWGALEEVRLIGAAPVGRGMTRAVLGLRHARGDQRLQATFLHDGKLSTLTFDGPRFALVRRYVPTARGTFETFNWVDDQPLPVIRFDRDPEGHGASLVVESEAGIAKFRRR